MAAKNPGKEILCVWRLLKYARSDGYGDWTIQHERIIIICFSVLVRNNNWTASFEFPQYNLPFLFLALPNFLFPYRQMQISINLLVVYRESVNLIGYITRRLSADSQQLWIANENRSPVYFDQTRSFKF